MPLYRATASNLTNLVAADGSSGGFVKDAQAGAGGLALLDDATIAELQQTLAGAGSAYGPARALFSASAVNMNATTDQTTTKLGTFTSYRVLFVIVDSLADIRNAVGGIYDAGSTGGNAIVAAGQVFTGFTASGISSPLTVNTRAALTGTPIVSLTTPHGSAGTANYLIIGTPLS